jgi:hypothetical protein
MTEESFIRNMAKCCFKKIPHFNEKDIIKKLLTILICIWKSVGKNLMYVHACETSQILKTQYLITSVTTATSELKPKSDSCPNLFLVVAGVPACVHSITAI